MNDQNKSTEPVMPAETLEALRGSIAKWEGIVAGTLEDKGPDNCPLCQKFNAFVSPDASYGCAGCPVRDRTGRSGCLGTPYEAYEDYESEHEEDADGLRKLAQEELDFLKSLLPPLTALDVSK